MPFVLDASIAGCWALEDEQHSRADEALARILTEEAVVPSLWWFEVRNILLINERRKRINESGTTGFLRYLATLPIRSDRFPEEAGILRLARDYRLSIYDAAYLELALRESIPLATLDSALISAARAEKIPLIGEA
jgi:predicted nucleic acid-binding protein